MTDPVQSDSVGLSFRAPHTSQILSTNHNIDFFEVLIDNYFGAGKLKLQTLEAVAARFPIAFHSVGMNIGGSSEVDIPFLRWLKELSQAFEPFVMSDHLAWVAHKGTFHHDLLPIPLNESTLVHCAGRINIIQESLQHKICIENPSVYLQVNSSEEMTEPEFLNDLAKRTGCGLLLDINNLYVTANNLDKNPSFYLESIQYSQVDLVHMAGHSPYKDLIIDDHGSEISEPVMELLVRARKAGLEAPIMIEWDKNLPEFSVLENEVERIRSLAG